MNSATVVTTVTNVYREPNLDAEVVTQARFGEPLRVTSFDRDWMKVEVEYDGYPGFVQRADLTEGNWLADCPDTASVRSLFANIYSGPKVQSRLLAVLPLGAQLPVLDKAEREGWYVVELGPGNRAFAQEGDLDQLSQEWHWSTIPELRRSLVRTAHRLLGVPYRWGGISPFGIDCSGYVQLLYKLHGLFLPRDANQQAKYGKTREVSRAEIVPGDLIFFAKYGHVGMAISHDEFIHATTYRVPIVQVSSIDDPHWAEITDEVRRYEVK